MTATWTAPRTWTAGEIVIASVMNTHVRDNMDFLKTPAAAIDSSSSVSTTSATLTDVTGSSVTLTATGTGGVDLYWVGDFSVTSTATITIALVGDGSVIFQIPYATSMTSFRHGCSFPYHIASVTAGSHTYKMQVSTNAGTVTVTGYLTYAIERGA